jgi:hypothetical protein
MAAVEGEYNRYSALVTKDVIAYRISRDDLIRLDSNIRSIISKTVTTQRKFLNVRLEQLENVSRTVNQMSVMTSEHLER